MLATRRPYASNETRRELGPSRVLGHKESFAARHYHGRPAASLGPAEAARLAVMLPNPRRYEKSFGPRLAAHAARVQRRMVNSQVP